MKVVDLTTVSDADRKAAAAIADEAQVHLKDCYQCGKCSAGCPMVQGMDLMPREVIRFLQFGMVDTVLKAKSPWVCAQCDVCSTRCPQNVDIASIMRAVRHASIDAGKKPVPQAEVFEDAFIKNIRQYGRSNEQYLAMKFNLRSGHFFQDVAHAPSMLSRKMIGIQSHSIETRDEVAQLIDRVLGANGASKRQPEDGEADA